MRLRGAQAATVKSPPTTPSGAHPRQITTRSNSKQSSGSNSSSTGKPSDAGHRNASYNVEGDDIDTARPAKYARTGSGRLRRESSQLRTTEPSSFTASREQLEDDTNEGDDAIEETKDVPLSESSPEKLPTLPRDSLTEASNALKVSALPSRLQGKRPKGWHLRKENRHLRRAVMQGSPGRSERQDSVETQDALRYEPGGILKRLPGRRRAPHHDPSIEADMRRQLELKIAYRAVTKALKPVLTEIARRTQADLETDAVLHCQYNEFDSITETLDKKLEERLEILDHEYRLEEARLCRLMDAEKEIIEKAYQTGIVDKRDEAVSRCQYHFMSTLRKSQQHMDSDATDDEDGLVPRLYRVQDDFSDRIPLDKKHDSRSRMLVEIDRYWNTLITRMELSDMQRKADPESVIPAPKDVASFDLDKRAVARAGVAVLTLVDAGCQVESDAAREARRVSNTAAVGLQALAKATEIVLQPAKIPKTTESCRAVTPKTPIRAKEPNPDIPSSKKRSPHGIASLLRDRDFQEEENNSYASPPLKPQQRIPSSEQNDTHLTARSAQQEMLRGVEPTYEVFPSQEQASTLPPMQLHRQAEKINRSFHDQMYSPHDAVRRSANEESTSLHSYGQDRQAPQYFQPLHTFNDFRKPEVDRGPLTVVNDGDEVSRRYVPYFPHQSGPPERPQTPLERGPVSRQALQPRSASDTARMEMQYLPQLRNSASLQRDVQSTSYITQHVESPITVSRDYDFPPPPPRYMAYATARNSHDQESYRPDQHNEQPIGKHETESKRKRSDASRQRSSTLPITASANPGTVGRYPPKLAPQPLHTADLPEASGKPAQSSSQHPNRHLPEQSGVDNGPISRDRPQVHTRGHEIAGYGDRFKQEDGPRIEYGASRIPPMTTGTPSEEERNRQRQLYETRDRSQHESRPQSAARDGRASPRRLEPAPIQVPDFRNYRPPQVSILQPPAPPLHPGQALHQPVSNRDQSHQEPHAAPPIARPIHQAYEKGAKIPLEMYPGQRIGQQILPATLAPIPSRHSPPRLPGPSPYLRQSYTVDGRAQVYEMRSDPPRGWPQRLENPDTTVPDTGHYPPQTQAYHGPSGTGPHTDLLPAHTADGKLLLNRPHHQDTPPEAPNDRYPSASTTSHTRTHSWSNTQTQPPTPLPYIRPHPTPLQYPSRPGSPRSTSQHWPGFNDPPHRSSYPPHPLGPQPGPPLSHQVPPGYHPVYPHLQPNIEGSRVRFVHSGPGGELQIHHEIELPLAATKAKRGRKSRAKPPTQRVAGEHDGRRRGRGGRGGGIGGSSRGGGQLQAAQGTGTEASAGTRNGNEMRNAGAGNENNASGVASDVGPAGADPATATT